MPNVQQSSHHALNFWISEEFRLRKGSMNVISDELRSFFLLGILLESWLQNVCIDHGEIILSFSINGLHLVILIGGHVLEQEFPDSSSILDRDSIPSKLFQFLDIDNFFI